MSYGLCQCGCGEQTPLAPQSSTRRGWVRGQPIPYVNAGHARRLGRLWEERDHGYITPCWDWLGAISTGGYGRFRVGDSPSRLAHRVVYERYMGAIPDGLQLDHLCRNRACVNPEHLEPVTLAENIARGVSANARKTHCPQGHQYSEDNTYVRASGQRVCRTCSRTRNNRSYHAKRAEATR